MSTWKAEAFVRVAELERRCGEPTEGEPSARATARRDLATLRHDIAAAPWTNWWTGDTITQVWGGLHRIEEDLNELEPDALRLASDARSHLARSPKRLAVLEHAIDKASPADTCTLARQAIKDAHHTSAARMAAERGRNRWVIVLSCALLAICVAVVGWDATTTGSLLPPPTGETELTGPALLVLVLVAGALGGVLSALYTLYMKKGSWDEARWFDPRPGLTVAKVAGGAVAALLGVLAVSTGAVTGTYSSAGSAFLLAAGFGFSQQVLTRYLDRSAKDVMEPRSATQAAVG